jgi:hypothetical protein
MHRCSNPDTQVFRWCLAHVTYVAPASATHITTSDPPLTVSPHRRRPPPSPPIISSHPRRHVSCKLSADARRNAAPACGRLRDTCSSPARRRRRQRSGARALLTLTPAPGRRSHGARDSCGVARVITASACPGPRARVALVVSNGAGARCVRVRRYRRCT